MTSHHYIACDLGAESGRVILGTLSDGVLTLKEVHRFANGPAYVDGTMRWDVCQIFDELETGLSRAAAELSVDDRGRAESVSIDSWGVDYVLLRADMTPLALPYHYRDPRTNGEYDSALASVPAETIFNETGIQFMPINTLYQLLAHQRAEADQLGDATQFLMIADYFHALLCGVGVAERSLASTSQLYNPKTGCWSSELLAQFDLPPALFPRLVDPGTILGPLLPDIGAKTGLADAPVIATCSHDTGAAIAAVPANEDADDDWAYLSSGTWSLLGVELSAPLINAQVQAANFTNEAGYGGSSRFLKNIAGLWIVQECRRAWLADGQDFTYDELTRMAEAAQPFRSLIQPADARFLAPGDMPGTIRDFCREAGQPLPVTPGEFVRCALESLALSYRETLEQVERLTGRTICRLHIVGGGSRSALLNQFAANATGRDVLAGPVEATAIGNLLLQAVTLGHLTGIDELRQTVRASFPIQSYTPANRPAWDDAFAGFQQMETHS